MPVPKATAKRSGSTSSEVSALLPEKPASAHASRAAMTDSCPEGSRRLASTRESTSLAGVETGAAIRTPRS